MKRKLLLLTVLLQVMSLSARERTLQEMQSIASKILFDRHITRSADNNETLTLKYKTDHVAILGSDAAGFAVITTDDRYQPVVGYGKGQYHFQEGDNLSWFIKAVNASISELSRMGTRNTVAPNTDKFKATVAPLLQTTWNQSSPYNDLCPEAANGTKYPSGCVATALSQIMKYHNYPETGQGEKQYSFKPADGEGKLLYANFGETTYDWANMLNNYVKGQYTETQGLAVATIMLQCGVAVEMNYTPTGSGAYSTEARAGLINNFKYNNHLGILSRKYYSLNEWMNIVYSELNQDRPIYYAGSDKTQGGHAFVIDGYDDQGMVHVNWGWGANGGNGYFDITLLNPSGYEFSVQQEMLIGIAKPDTDIAYESHLTSTYPLTVGKVSTLLNVSPGDAIWNYNGDAWEGKLAVVLKNKSNGKTYILGNEVTVTPTADRYNVLNNIKDGATLGGMKSLPKDIEDGIYYLFIGAKNQYDTDWSLVRRSEEQPNSFLIVVENGKPTSVEAETNDSWPGTITAISSPSIIKETNHNIYDLRGRNLGTDETALPKGIYIINGKKVVK